MPRVLQRQCHDKIAASIRGVAMRVLVSTGLIGLLSFGTVAFAAADLGAGNPAPVQLSAPSKVKFGQLENKLFGHAFENETVELRTSRLEQLIFGEEASGSVAARVEKLLSLYSDAELAPPPVAKPATAKPVSKPVAAAAKPAATKAKPQEFSLDDEESRELEEYPRITALETAILGKTREGDALSARLNNLETKAFGAPSNLPDFSRRTEALETYAEKTLHKKVLANAGPIYQKEAPPVPRQVNGQSQAGSGGSSGLPKAVLATVANTLIGATTGGMGPLGILPAAAMGIVPRLVSGRANSANAASAAEAAPPPADDFSAGPLAAVPAEDPPPDSARLLSKVAWCEKQLFGQTFPSRHLTERLRQLSQELHFETNKSDFELMDDISGMINAVQKRQKAKPISAVEPPVSVQ